MPEKKLPNDANGLFLTDSGLETSLIFHDRLDLPLFASFVLLKTAEGRSRLKRYFAHHAEVAAAHGAGFVWKSVTWRASSDWGDKLGYSARLLAEANRESIDLMREVAAGFRTTNIFSGNIGPHGDGYVADAAMSADAAADYHARQVEVFAEAECDLVSAFTMTHTAEAIGVVRAAIRHDMPCVISFTVETDGRLPSGESLAQAIERTDAETGGHPSYYMINCAPVALRGRSGARCGLDGSDRRCARQCLGPFASGTERFTRSRCRRSGSIRRRLCAAAVSVAAPACTRRLLRHRRSACGGNRHGLPAA